MRRGKKKSKEQIVLCLRILMTVTSGILIACSVGTIFLTPEKMKGGSGVQAVYVGHTRLVLRARMKTMSSSVVCVNKFLSC